MDIHWQLVAYVFVSIILWMVAAQLNRRRMDHSWIRALGEGWVASILRFVYYVGLPYAALILGVVPGRYLGLVGLDQLQAREAVSGGLEAAPGGWGLLSRTRDDLSLVVLGWLPDVRTMAGLAAIMFLLLAGSWLGYRYARTSAVSGLGIKLASTQAKRTRAGVQVVYQAVHWSFYRSAIWLLTGDLYLGVVGGMLLVVGEWMLDPGWMESMRRAPLAEDLLVDSSLLIATSVMFFFVPNLWLLLPIHGLLAFVSRRLAAPGAVRFVSGP